MVGHTVYECVNCFLTSSLHCSSVTHRSASVSDIAKYSVSWTHSLWLQANDFAAKWNPESAPKAALPPPSNEYLNEAKQFDTLLIAPCLTQTFMRGRRKDTL